MIDDARIDLIRADLKDYAWQQGYGLTAEQFGVSQQALWRFLERG